MSSLRLFLWSMIALWLSLGASLAEDRLTALARVDGAASGVVDLGKGVEVTLTLSQPVPWRVFTLEDPRRLVLDLSEVTWPDTFTETSANVAEIRMGAYRPGWSRMVLDLEDSLGVASASLDRAGDGTATLRLQLMPVDAALFAEQAGPPPGVRAPKPVRTARIAPRPRPDRPGRLIVALDPGHGGRDSGARYDGLMEKHLMLGFARELAEVLRRSDLDVVLVREDDSFVPLETRIKRARAAGAGAFISLHADSLAEGTGDARGATVYTLSDEASDLASRRIAERHNQADLLFGVDLSGQSDEISLVLMDMARTETAPRSDRLADLLVSGLKNGLGRVNNRPRREANFSVLKAPDIPSVLIELGFMSNESDRANLTDPDWRAKAAEAIRGAILEWQDDDLLRAELLRQ